MIHYSEEEEEEKPKARAVQNFHKHL